MGRHNVAMATWSDVHRAAGDLAEAVRARFEATGLAFLATIRRDGSPRISGIEAFFADGDLWFGSMPNARKALDLRRDPRFALHSGSADPPEWEGDAKISGGAEEVGAPERRLAVFSSRGSDPPSSESHLFRADIDEAVLVGLNEARDRLVIELWRPGRELKRMERE